MTAFELMQHRPDVFVGIVAVLGLMVGSFLNVVIYRLPVMVRRARELDARACLALPHTDAHPAFNLATPSSACPACGHAIRAWENIPVISWLFLRGRCSGCGTRISLRYPIIELVTGLLSAGIAFRFGYGLPCAFALGLLWASIAVLMIEFDEALLPNEILIPGIWLGLIAGYLSLFVPLESAVLGAVGGYLVVAIPSWCVSSITGSDGGSRGVSTLMAMSGAWLGWQMLPAMVILASLVTVLWGTMAYLTKRRPAPYPFRPFIMVSALACLVWGHSMLEWMSQVTGLIPGVFL